MAIISDIMGFSAALKRFMQRRRYKRLHKLNGERRRARAIKLGGSEGRSFWKLKFVPKLKLSYTKIVRNVSTKSWLRIKETPNKKAVEDFNNKLITEIYKSLGVQVVILPRDSAHRHIR